MAAWRASGRRSSVRRGGGGPPGALSHKAILERPVGDSCRIVTPADRAFDNVGLMGGDPRRSALTAAMAIDVPPCVDGSGRRWGEPMAIDIQPRVPPVVVADDGGGDHLPGSRGSRDRARRGVGAARVIG